MTLEADVKRAARVLVPMYMGSSSAMAAAQSAISAFFRSREPGDDEVEVVARSIKRQRHIDCCSGAALDDVTARLGPEDFDIARAAIRAHDEWMVRKLEETR